MLCSAEVDEVDLALEVKGGEGEWWSEGFCVSSLTWTDDASHIFVDWTCREASTLEDASSNVAGEVDEEEVDDYDDDEEEEVEDDEEEDDESGVSVGPLSLSVAVSSGGGRGKGRMEARAALSMIEYTPTITRLMKSLSHSSSARGTSFLSHTTRRAGKCWAISSQKEGATTFRECWEGRRKKERER